MNFPGSSYQLASVVEDTKARRDSLTRLMQTPKTSLSNDSLLSPIEQQRQEQVSPIFPGDISTLPLSSSHLLEFSKTFSNISPTMVSLTTTTTTQSTESGTDSSNLTDHSNNSGLWFAAPSGMSAIMINGGSPSTTYAPPTTRFSPETS